MAKKTANKRSRITKRAATTTEQILTLASPTRHAMLQVILNQGEASVREVADQLGKKPATLYKHIDRLLEVGLIWEVGTKPTTRRDARVFGSDMWNVKYDPNDPERIAALVSFIQSELRNASRRIDKAMHGNPVIVGPKRDTFFAPEFGWLNEEELAELNRLINATLELMTDKPRRPGTKLIAHSLVMYPMPIDESEDD